MLICHGQSYRPPHLATPWTQAPGPGCHLIILLIFSLTDAHSIEAIRGETSSSGILGVKGVGESKPVCALNTDSLQELDSEPMMENLQFCQDDLGLVTLGS